PFDPYEVARQHAILAAALRGLGRTERAGDHEERARAQLAALNAREAVRLEVLLAPEPPTGAPATPPEPGTTADTEPLRS
ncbi:hypothetical protein QR77_24290, partial [Streptomyces sp. 150FB]|uniref:hypothetical protein n=1 Tax=Streptomyces sp. 150FB TaxID=1576605 RepID=UPI0005893F3F